MDAIRIQNIRCYGYTGFLPEEQVLGQWFEVNLILWVDLAPAGDSDDIKDTLDYRQAIADVKSLIETQKFSLIEKLASAIAQSLLNFNLVQKVSVSLSKPSPPIPNFGGEITVEITREKS
ncbi:dihydroneopterin aldolase [Euhalothece natronophila Z-M001]|uniref:7,8-dihydroneopterin aldolase n=1 Tax=Euhalothece natronophila Z-M001 TaxID=522448 RepID=A0A5B8NSE5_9CHRO|nr:dihydroneopterin aldolase [Euhalothece natronophila]QDZ41259.1 dihydroneopterin aldolase [Euhalothece natronophila Z-M001]